MYQLALGFDNAVDQDIYYTVGLIRIENTSTGSGQINLHPVQLAGADATLKTGWSFSSTASGGTFTVPARTTAVLVQFR